MDNNSAADISKKRTGREVTVYNEDSDSALINNDIHLEPLVKGPSINCTNKLTKTAKKLKIKDEYLEVGDICYVSPSNEDSIESYYSIVLVEAFFGKVIKGKSLLRYHDLTKYLKLNDANVLCKDPQELFLSNIVKDMVVKKCVVFFLRNSNDFSKLNNIRQVRDAFYCTKTCVLMDNDIKELKKLSKEDIKSTFTSLESNASLLLNQVRTDKPKLIALDLFSGCGGLSLGLHKAGIHVKYCVEQWNKAVETYKRNFKETETTVFQEEAETFLELIKAINKLKDKYKVNDNMKYFLKKESKIEKIEIINGKLNFFLFRETTAYKEKELGETLIINFLIRKYYNFPRPGAIDLICGGPPCQGFSSANRKTEQNSEEYMKGDKNRMVTVFLRYVEYLKPKYVLLENVTGILKTSVYDVPCYINTELDSFGYKTHYGCLNALHYGLPQSRNRVFFLACKKGGILPDFPEHTHAAKDIRVTVSLEKKKELVKHPREVTGGFLPEVTIRDFISDLNEVELPEKGKDTVTYKNPPMTVYQEELRKNSSELYNHKTRGFKEPHTTLIRCMPRKSGASFEELPENVNPLLKNDKKKHFARNRWSGYYNTIMTYPNPSKTAVIHPNQNRVYSCRESCRAQGFPDDFVVIGTVKAIYKQIGNAVPVNIAKCLGDEIVKAEMKHTRRKTFDDKKELDKLLKRFKECFSDTEEWLNNETLQQPELLEEELLSYQQPLPDDLLDEISLPKTIKDKGVLELVDYPTSSGEEKEEDEEDEEEEYSDSDNEEDEDENEKDEDEKEYILRPLNKEDDEENEEEEYIDSGNESF